MRKGAKTIEQPVVLEIVQCLKSGKNVQVISEMYNIKPDTIHKIKARCLPHLIRRYDVVRKPKIKNQKMAKEDLKTGITLTIPQRAIDKIGGNNAVRKKFADFLIEKGYVNKEDLIGKRIKLV